MNVSGARTPVRAPKPLTKEEVQKSIASASATQAASSTRDKKSKKKSKRTNKKKQPNGIKLVVRLLPPDLKPEEFWSKTADFINPKTCYDKIFICGRYSKKPFKLPVYSRAYILFKDVQFIDNFIKNFKNKPFEDQKESMIPQFAQSLYPRMLDSSKPLISGTSSSNGGNSSGQSLLDHPAYKLFLKFHNGEIERPKSLLVSEKKAVASPATTTSANADGTAAKKIKILKKDEEKIDKKDEKKKEKNKKSKKKETKDKEPQKSQKTPVSSAATITSASSDASTSTDNKDGKKATKKPRQRKDQKKKDQKTKTASDSPSPSPSSAPSDSSKSSTPKPKTPKPKQNKQKAPAKSDEAQNQNQQAPKPKTKPKILLRKPETVSN